MGRIKMALTLKRSFSGFLLSLLGVRGRGGARPHGEGGRGNSACPESALARTEEISQSFSVKIIPARRSGGPDGEAAASSV